MCKGQTTAHARVDIGGALITVSITNEAVGQEAIDVFTASDVTVVKA